MRLVADPDQRESTKGNYRAAVKAIRETWPSVVSLK